MNPNNRHYHGYGGFYDTQPGMTAYGDNFAESCKKSLNKLCKWVKLRRPGCAACRLSNAEESRQCGHHTRPNIAVPRHALSAPTSCSQTRPWTDPNTPGPHSGHSPPVFPSERRNEQLSADEERRQSYLAAKRPANAAHRRQFGRVGPTRWRRQTCGRDCSGCCPSGWLYAVWCRNLCWPGRVIAPCHIAPHSPSLQHSHVRWHCVTAACHTATHRLLLHHNTVHQWLVGKDLLQLSAHRLCL